MRSEPLAAPTSPDRGVFLRAVVITLIAALVLVLLLSFRRDPRDIRTGTVGKPAPGFQLDLLDGSGRLSMADFKGKVVVINFWASWCLPCKEENPALARTWERYRSADVVLVGIVYQDSHAAALE